MNFAVLSKRLSIVWARFGFRVFHITDLTLLWWIDPCLGHGQSLWQTDNSLAQYYIATLPREVVSEQTMITLQEMAVFNSLNDL